jgi:hypothetical protein
MMDASAEEKDTVLSFTSQCQRIAGLFLNTKGELAQLPNSIQLENLEVADYVAHLVPWMMRAITDSDLVQLRYLIGTMQDLMMSMAPLAALEEDIWEEALRECGMLL